MKINEKIFVIDFGGQYNELIARRVRDLGTYAEVIPYQNAIEKINEEKPIGIIFTGGPNSVYEEKSPKIDVKIFDLNIPILGICYGAQLIAYELGGVVEHTEQSEFGQTKVYIENDNENKSKLLKNINNETITFMSHNDYISAMPKGFVVTAKTNVTPFACIENEERKIYAVQWHPEVKDTIDGNILLSNFVNDICASKKLWTLNNFVDEKILELREQIQDKKVLLALSGGVDSSVTAAILSKAIGKNLYCVFVNHGLLRKNEAEEVCKIFGEDNGKFDLNFIYVDAKNRFLQKLQGVVEPEKKRKIIGEEFIRVFEEESQKLGKINYLAQGTIYADVIESGKGLSATIKSHHNVGGLPKDVGFEGIIEPLKYLFKDEVRRTGLNLGLPEHLVYRQPFPGPGLGIRIIGDVTEDKIRIVQEADFIFREEIKKAKLDTKISQYYAALSNMKSVGVMGDGRTYDYAVVLRAVITDDFMTCNIAEIPYDVLKTTMTRIVNEVKGVNRVLYDISSKPPATVELE